MISAATGSSTARSRALRRRSRTPRPPVRSIAGACSLHTSARRSTSRSASSAAVVARRSSSAGSCWMTSIAGGLADTSPSGTDRSASATSRGSSTVCEPVGTSKPRIISRCGGGTSSAAGQAVGSWALRTVPIGGPAASRSRTSRSAGVTAAIISASRAESASTSATAAPARGWPTGVKPILRNTAASWVSGTSRNSTAAGRPRPAGYGPRASAAAGTRCRACGGPHTRPSVVSSATAVSNPGGASPGSSSMRGPRGSRGPRHGPAPMPPTRAGRARRGRRRRAALMSGHRAGWPVSRDRRERASPDRAAVAAAQPARHQRAGAATVSDPAGRSPAGVTGGVQNVDPI